jgi:hypothetical protein
MNVVNLGFGGPAHFLFTLGFESGTVVVSGEKGPLFFVAAQVFIPSADAAQVFVPGAEAAEVDQ